MAKYYIDGRVLVNGKKSKILMDNPKWINNILEWATDAEVIAGTSTNTVVSPATLAAALGSIGDLDSVLTNGNNTGVNDIEMADDQVILAENGGGQLSLRDGADSTIGLTTDNGGYTEGWFYADPTIAQMGFGTTPTVDLNATSARLNYQFADAFAYISLQSFGLADYTNEAVILKTIAIGSTGTHASSFSCNGGGAVALNSGTIIASTNFNINTSYSVALGGTGITVKTDNTAYCNQLGLNASGSAFEGLVDTAVLTADRTYEFPDASGVVNITRYIGVNTPTVHTAMTGEVVGVTTGAGALVVNLPSAAIANQVISIHKVDNGAGAVTITAAGADTIKGLGTLSLPNQYNSATLVSDGGTSWLIISNVV
jgi:hypothetical protein